MVFADDEGEDEIQKILENIEPMWYKLCKGRMAGFYIVIRSERILPREAKSRQVKKKDARNGNCLVLPEPEVCQAFRQLVNENKYPLRQEKIQKCGDECESGNAEESVYL